MELSKLYGMDTPGSIPGASLLQSFLYRMRAEEEERQGKLGETAQSAFDRLTQAQAAPAPMPDPMSSGIEQLFGDVASTISRKPEFAQRSREDIMMKRAMLMQQRGENLEILRSQYIAAAEKVGKMDPIKEMKYRETAEQLAKVLDQAHEEELHAADAKAAMDRTRATVQGGIDEANIRAEVDRETAAMGLMTKLPKDEFDVKWNKVFTDFTDPKTRGITNENRPLAKMSLLNLSTADDTPERYEARLIEAFKKIDRSKKLSLDDAKLIRIYSSLKFAKPTVVRDTGNEEADLNAPALEPNTGEIPPGAQKLIDEANKLLPLLNAKGPLGAAKAQQAEKRFSQIQALLKNRFGLRMGLPVPQIPGIEVRP